MDVAHDELTGLRDTAVTVAREAAELVRAGRIAAIAEVDTKSSETDVVTAADTAAEQLIRRRLAALRPGEPVLGEEGGGELAADGLSWVVDPIDGTVNYLYGFPWYAVSVAVQRDGVSVAGAVVEPAGGRVWTAVRGRGAECDGAPLRVSSCTRLELAMLATGFSYQVERRRRQAAMMANVITKVRDVRRAGAASLDLCAVAAGWTDGYAEHGLHRWDWAAGALIAQEAGAIVTLPGADPDLGDEVTFAAAPGIADALRGVLLDSGIAAV
ncbi:MAG: inositol monophosphatase family protein [Sciscionella sp.]